MPFVWWQAFHKSSLNQGCIIRITRVCHLLALGLWRETAVQCGFLLYPWLRHIQLRTSSSHQRRSGQEARHLYGCPSAREWSETGLRRGNERGDVWLFHLRAFIRDVNLAVRNKSLECIKRQSKKALVYAPVSLSRVLSVIHISWPHKSTALLSTALDIQVQLKSRYIKWKISESLL